MEQIIKEIDVGLLEFTLPKEVVAGGELEWKVHFTAHREFKPGSHIRITVPAYQHQRSEQYLQVHDYWMPNYLWAIAEEESVQLEVHVEKIETDFKHIKRWNDSCRVGVITLETGLKPGEAITIHFGGIDRPWLEGDCMPSRAGQLAFHKEGTYLNYILEFDLLGAQEYKQYDVFPSIKLIPDTLTQLQVTCKGYSRPGETLEASILPMDRFGNPLYEATLDHFKLSIFDLRSGLLVATTNIAGQKASIALEQGAYKLTIEDSGLHVNDAVIICEENAPSLFWGDTHIHSNLTANIRDNDLGSTPERGYTHAREVSKLDFLALTEQTYTFNEDRGVNIDKATWQAMAEECDRFDDPGKFVTMTGFELHCRRGDTICLFRGSLSNYDYPGYEFGILHDVWDFYKDHDILTIPHLHRFSDRMPKYAENKGRKAEIGFDLKNWEPDSHHETMVEIYSAQWGRFEYEGNPMLLKSRRNIKNNTVVDFLNRGKKWGFVANSDGHDGNPGYGGVTGVYTDTLTRESIFDALHNRQTIATTHPRMVMDFNVNDAHLGQTITSTGSVDLYFRVAAPRKLKRIEVIHNGEVLKRIDTDQQYQEVELSETFESGEHYFYVRCFQDDGHIGWVSPIWANID
ncbi:DUF3604 domain-containing protein [Endozoicomonas elysicola]|uniref:DUF3604 domain-containing protein n=1 Tax=Endozoicomonas elysicola TaxID=305900 RepID=A0A081K588_9GAMM|nr:DUF3604 domain-containing protein [Endozoicomonas elysicola]KEI69314.1 hypothetical protein GV64_24515 [Endozoicomonas elysicola]